MTNEKIRVGFGNADLLVIKAEKGYLACGYIAIETAERLGDAACIVTGVKTFEDMLSAKVAKASSKAKVLGIKEGMPGEEALLLLAGKP